MPSSFLPADLAAEVKRGAGVFTAMAGSGIILESRASWIGAAITLAGLAAFVSGLREVQRKQRMAVGKEHPAAATVDSADKP